MRPGRIRAGLLAAALLSGGAAWANEASVVIDNFTFTPAVLTIPAGTKVTWTNRDDLPHTIVSREDPGGRRSPALDTDDSFSLPFDTPGTFHYFCSLHPQMQGTVVVR